MTILRKTLVLSMGAFITALPGWPVLAQGPYAGQETRAIKALAPEQIQSYETGKGMELAKAAELNGYPGPSHVLELASDLGLSGEQRRDTEAIFRRMQSEASELGRRLVRAERELDQRFAAKTITVSALAESLHGIGELQTQIRLAHLKAHLEQVALLSSAQVAKYDELRGYAGAADTKTQHRHHRHQH